MPHATKYFPKTKGAPFPYFIFLATTPPHPPTLGPPGLLCKSASHRSAAPGNSAHRLQCRPPFPPTHPPPSMSTFNALPPSQCPQAKSRASPAGTKRLRARFGLISGIGPAGLNRDLARNLFQEILLKFLPILPTQCSHGKRREGLCVFSFSCIASAPGKDVRLRQKINDNALVAHQSNLFPLHSVLMVD